ncbi:MAG: sigma-70 family RNA polymerase sigma factor [Thermodesulfovibrionales bacterium]|jgi:RNA polymerase sigma-70 factor (ECF subfamily)
MDNQGDDRPAETLFREGTKASFFLSNNEEGRQQRGVDEDRDIVVSVRKGNIDEFEKLVQKYQKLAFNIAYRIVGSYEDACEVVQDAFLSGYRNLDGFKGISKFSTWLCSIVINLSKNRILKMKAENRHEQYSLDDPVETNEGPTGREFSSGEPSVLEKMERKEVRDRLQDCLKELEHEFREVIVLRDIQGFSYGEVAGILNIAEGTVKSRLFRARDAVRDCLKKVMGEP